YTCIFFFFQAENGIRDLHVTGVQTCALPISGPAHPPPAGSGWPTSTPGRPRASARDACTRPPAEVTDGPGGRRRAGGRPAAPSGEAAQRLRQRRGRDRKSTRLNSSHVKSSYAVFCLKKKK